MLCDLCWCEREEGGTRGHVYQAAAAAAAAATTAPSSAAALEQVVPPQTHSAHPPPHRQSQRFCGVALPGGARSSHLPLRVRRRLDVARTRFSARSSPQQVHDAASFCFLIKGRRRRPFYISSADILLAHHNAQSCASNHSVVVHSPSVCKKTACVLNVSRNN